MTRISLGITALLAFTLLLGLPRIAHAAESYDNCTGFITSLPAVVSTSGTWCLNQNLSTAITTGNAITIASNDVTIDCNDFRLDGAAAGLGTRTIGILAINRLNSKVRRCDIRGFFIGLSFEGMAGGKHVVENNRLDGNTFTGLDVQGNGSVIRGNRVLHTGGSDSFPAGNSPAAIHASNSVDILDNTISDVRATSGLNGDAYGIYVEMNFYSSISGNILRGIAKDGSGVTHGIYGYQSGRLTVRNNDLTGDASAGSIGIRCEFNDTRTKDNVISGFVTGIAFCNDSGGNDITP